jgi:uncharacterized protein
MSSCQSIASFCDSFVPFCPSILSFYGSFPSFYLSIFPISQSISTTTSSSCKFAKFLDLCRPKKFSRKEEKEGEMGPLDRFRIEFGALGVGEHDFQFEIDDKFFEQFEHSPVEHGSIDVLVTVNRDEQNMMLVDFTMEGTVTLPCDRCAEDLELEVSGYNELIVKFGEAHEEDEEVVVLSPKEHALNVAQYIYEYIALMIPLRNVHPDDEKGNSMCDPEALERLEKLRVHEANEEEEHPVDPRWDILKNINLN